MYKTSIFQLQIVCDGCNNYITVSGITDFDTCQNCGKKINVLSVINNNLFGIMHKDKYLTGFLSGSIEQLGGSGAYKLSYSSMQPYCEECFVTIDEDSAVQAISSGNVFKCTKCGHIMPVRAADNLLLEFHPKAVGVLNDANGIDSGERNTEKDSMLVFKCMTCGAGLELSSKTKRTINCNYCDNDNYLPDSIWTKLHPNKEVQPLFLILDIDEKDIINTIEYFLSVTALKIYSKHFDNFIREYFERPFVNDALIWWLKEFLSAENNKQVEFNMDMEKIQKNFLNNVKLSFDSHPIEIKLLTAEFGKNMDEELQYKLAKDKDEKVRLALTQNKGLTKNIIMLLQSDNSATVKKASAKMKTNFLSKLFGK